jgi:hypothetical protein
MIFRRIIALGFGILLIGLGIAGCSSPTSSNAIDEIPNESAKERALDAEEAYLKAQFRNASCVESWGTYATAGIDRNATIINRTADGVYVEVTHPYWYGTDDNTEVDDGSTALYLVKHETVHRIRGDDVSPCSN